MADAVASQRESERGERAAAVAGFGSGGGDGTSAAASSSSSALLLLGRRSSSRSGSCRCGCPRARSSDCARHRGAAIPQCALPAGDDGQRVAGLQGEIQ